MRKRSRQAKAASPTPGPECESGAVPVIAPEVESAFPGLETVLTGQLLRWAVGRQMFCRTCSTVLDCRRAVLIDSPTGGSAVICGACWDKAADHVRGRFPDLEVTDGRTLAALDII